MANKRKFLGGQWLTQEGVADYFGVTIRTVRNWIKRKENPIPHYTVGGRFRFELSELEEWVKAKADKPKNQPKKKGPRKSRSRGALFF